MMEGEISLIEIIAIGRILLREIKFAVLVTCSLPGMKLTLANHEQLSLFLCL